MNKTKITIEATVNAPVQAIWKMWSNPEDIKKWNSASDDWHTPHAENDLREGGKFSFRMEAKDGSFGFDFWGHYNKVEEYKTIDYTMGDDRKVWISFAESGGQTHIIETFEAEEQNPIELQRDGWQAILNNFKKYAEANAK